MTSAPRARCNCFAITSQLDDTADDIAVLKQYGVPFEVLDRDGCIAAEPALAAVKDKIAGGLRLPQDETGDCHMFTQALAVEAEKLGVRFAFNVGIEGLIADATRVTGVATSNGRAAGRRLCRRARQLVVAAGAAARHFAAGLSGQGLFDHGADHRSRRRAGVDRDGRELQGRDHAAWRPHPRRRHRRNFRLFRQALCRRGARRSITR